MSKATLPANGATDKKLRTEDYPAPEDQKSNFISRKPIYRNECIKSEIYERIHLLVPFHKENPDPKELGYAMKSIVGFYKDFLNKNKKNLIAFGYKLKFNGSEIHIIIEFTAEDFIDFELLVPGRHQEVPAKDTGSDEKSQPAPHQDTMMVMASLSTGAGAGGGAVIVSAEVDGNDAASDPVYPQPTGGGSKQGADPGGATNP